MRGLPPALALVLGAAVGCYHEDFLLGAYCVNESQCGDDQCCASRRCRPFPTDCSLGIDDEGPFLPAYDPCRSDDECLEHGLVRCAFWNGARVGFCTDLCVGGALNCENHEFNYSPESETGRPRTCITIDDQSLCALDCAPDGLCPPDMYCRSGACVPTDDAP